MSSDIIEYRHSLLVKGEAPNTSQKEKAREIATYWAGICHLSQYEVDLLTEDIAWAFHEQALMFENFVIGRLEKLGVDTDKIEKYGSDLGE